MANGNTGYDRCRANIFYGESKERKYFALLFPINFAAIKIQLQHHIDKMQHSAFQHNHFISYFYVLNIHRNFLADTI